MDFIDNNGKIFNLDSYDIEPIGYEFDNKPYIFWIDSVNQNKLSINNFYIKTINLLLPYKEDIEYNINIKIDSHIFYLLSSKQIQLLVNENKSLTDVIKISENDLKTELNSENENDLLIYKFNDNDKPFLLIPLYIVCNSEVPGVWTTNILITVDKKISNNIYKEWCPITVGGEFVELSEELIINGQNMGINLPVDILRSLYKESFFNETINEQLYNEKLKEYLLNYMNIKGEIGNFRSVENSLAWFGYKDYIHLAKLYQTDNEFKNQFIKDYFDINNDIIKTYKTFRNSTYISLLILLNKDTDKTYNFDFSNDLYGESHPILESLIDKTILAKNDNGDNKQYFYIKSYYDYGFTELGLKLACLKYYFEKYFLPIHLSIHSASLNHKVYMNDTKMLSNITTQLTENTMLIGDEKNEIEFNPNNNLYFTHQIHYIDSYYNEFSDYNENEDIYYINDTCINVPINFNNINKLYDCILILTKNNLSYEKYPYIININQILHYTSTLEIYDKYNNPIDLSEIYFAYSIDKKKYSDYIKGYENIKKSINISSAKNYSSEYDINNNIYDGKIEIIKNKDIIEYYIIYGWNKYKIIDKQQSIYVDNIQIIIPPLEDFNINVFNNTIISGNIYIIYDFYIRLKYSSNIISKIIINKEELINGQIDRIILLDEHGKTNEFDRYIDGHLITHENNTFIELENSLGRNNNLDYFSITYLPSKEIIYESHFKFFQTETNKYKNFIIYPKLLNKEKNITYFIDNNFTIDLLVNNKWYKYDFNLKIPEPIIKLGKLEYKYWNNSEHYLSNFSQLKNLVYDPNNEKYSIEFNSFMHENKLVEVNHINFMNDYLKYIAENNLKYIDGKYINKDDFYYSIKFNDEIIRIHKDTYKLDFIIPVKNLSESNQIYIYKNITGDYVILFMNESDNFIIGSNSKDNEIKLEDDGPEYVEFKYDEKNNVYIVETDTEIIELDIWETMHYTESQYMNKYLSRINIGNNNKYLNNIHLFNLYINEIETKEIPILTNNSELNFKGLKLSHKNYLNKDTIHIEGIFKNQRQINNKDFSNISNYNFESSDSVSTYNDYDLFVVTDDNAVKKYSYGYYTDKTGKKTTEPYSMVLNNITENFGYKYFKTLQEIQNLYGKIEFNEIDFIEPKYTEYKNKLFCTDGILSVKRQDVLNTNKYYDLPVYIKLEFGEFDNKNNWKKYELSNTDYLKFYNTIIDENTSDNKYHIKANLVIKDGKLYNNILHISENSEGNIKLPVAKYITANNEEILFPWIKNNIKYENDKYIFENDDFDAINNIWENNYFCIKLDTSKLSDKSYILKYDSGQTNNIIISPKILKNNEIIEYNSIFTLSKNDVAYIYIEISNSELENMQNKINTDITISLQEITYKYIPYKYDPDLSEDKIDIEIAGTRYRFGNNTSKEICELYNDFFENYISFKKNNILLYNVYTPKYPLKDMILDYDFYLMHDNDYWYGLYISKQTIDKVTNINDLNIKEKEINISGANNSYILKYVNSSNEFLINRMKYIPVNGINQFKDNDLIVAQLINNQRLPVDIFQSPKWKITPMSLGINKDAITESSAEMCILSIPKSTNRYYKGYYDISVKYCIDNINQQQYKNQTKLLIK